MGQIGLGLAGDGNGNNQIEPGNYAVWRVHFGQTAGSGAAASAGSSNASVPEPATLVMLLLGMLVTSIADEHVCRNLVAIVGRAIIRPS